MTDWSAVRIARNIGYVRSVQSQFNSLITALPGSGLREWQKRDHGASKGSTAKPATWLAMPPGLPE